MYGIISRYQMLQEFNGKSNRELKFKLYIEKLKTENSNLKRENFQLVHKSHPYYKHIDNHIEVFKKLDKTITDKYDKIPINKVQYNWINNLEVLKDIKVLLGINRIFFKLIPFSNSIKKIESLLLKNELLKEYYDSYLLFTIDSFNNSLKDGWLILYYSDSYDKKIVNYIKDLLKEYFKINEIDDNYFSIRIHNF